MKQQTKIPEGWEVTKLGDIFSFVKTYPFPRDYLTDAEEGIKYIHYGDIHSKFKDLIVDLESEEIPVLKDESLVKNGNSFLEDGDLIIVDASEDYEGTGKCIELKNVGNSKVIAGLHTFALRDEKKKVVDGFRGYLLKNRITARELRKKATGFSVYGISKDTLSNLDLIIPPLKEQQAISKIISFLDNLIELNQEVINKMYIIKKSTINEIFSKYAVFENAELLCQRVTDGTHDTPKASLSGYPLVTSKNIKKGAIDFKTAYLISEKDFSEVNKRSNVDPGDVLFSMIGTIGESVIVDKDYPKFAIKNVGLFKTGGDFLFANLLHYYFQSDIFKSKIRGKIKKTTQQYMPLGGLRSFDLPKINEDSKNFVSSIIALDKKIELERESKDRLEKIKRGLINDLLIGKKRVNVENVLKIGGSR